MTRPGEGSADEEPAEEPAEGQIQADEEPAEGSADEEPAAGEPAESSADEKPAEGFGR